MNFSKQYIDELRLTKIELKEEIELIEKELDEIEKELEMQKKYIIQDLINILDKNNIENDTKIYFSEATDDYNDFRIIGIQDQHQNILFIYTLHSTKVNQSYIIYNFPLDYFIYIYDEVTLYLNHL